MSSAGAGGKAASPRGSPVEAAVPASAAHPLPPASSAMPAPSHSYSSLPASERAPIVSLPPDHPIDITDEETADETSFSGHPWMNPAMRDRLRQSRKTPEEISAMRSRAVRAFYEQQNDHIDDLLAPLLDYDHVSAAEMSNKVTWAVRASLGVNVLLFICQTTAAVSSGSMALLATAADAFMDLLSGAILLIADHAAKRQNVLDYPTGKKRYETIGVIIFSCLMAGLALQLIIEGAKSLAESQGARPDLEIKEIVLVCIALVAKFILFIYCSTLKESTSARTLRLDHRNDLALNSFGLTMSLLSKHVIWWLDPCGAIGIGLLILRSWSASAWENAQSIVGRSASSAVLNKITYLAATHHPRILQVDTCKAYWLGTHMFVEVDVVLPPEMSLRESHDIGETLQHKLESLPNVERAFVHCDYEFEHRPEHRLK